MPEERCPLNPSMYKRECTHCQGQARGTNENPRFSIRDYRSHGSPMVEILKNDGPVHRHDQHFSFGCRKARIIIACVDALKRFAWPSDPDDRTNFQPQIFTEKQLGVTIEVFAAMNPNFVVRDELIEKYWLYLRELPTPEIAQSEECNMTPEQRQEFFNRNGYWPIKLAEPEAVEIGLGVMKCKAVCSVQDELRSWLARRCH